MALSLREPHSRPKTVPPTRRSPAPKRRPFRDNTKLLLAGIAVLIAALASLLALASRSAAFAPDFLTEVVLYALSATNLTILVALVFVLARNIVKLLVEKRNALPFAHFRAKLVALMLGMTLIPAVLVLIAGSGVIRNSIDRWFNAPMDDVLSSANAIAADYYQERQRLVAAEAERLARTLSAIDLSSSAAQNVRDIVAPDVLQQRVSLVEVFSVERTGDRRAPILIPVADVGSAALPRVSGATQGDSLVARVASGQASTPVVERLADGGDLIRSAVAVRATPGGQPQGVVVAGDYVTTQFAARSRRMTEAYEDYQQLRVLRQPLAGVYLSFFLMLTLMILVGATWMGLYLTKRIIRPVQMLAAAANEIGAGHLDHRVEAETRDEFGSLIEAFNRMASDLSASRRRLERSAIELEHKHHDVEGRRQYVETVLERIATGVISVDTAGRIRTVNPAAARLLGLDTPVSGLPAASVFGSPDLKPLAMVIDDAARVRDDAPPREVLIVRNGREMHLTVMTTQLRRADGVSDGVVLVLEDDTPRVRAQKAAAWQDVARRLAHEIKNPLTPIQLSAERLRKHFGGAPSPTRELVEECTSTIVVEVESLIGLVNEFKDFARMPAPRVELTDLHALLTDVLNIYRGTTGEIELRPRFADALPSVFVDRAKIHQVIRNLVNNSLEAMGGRGHIDIETEHRAAENRVRIVVADDGPGIPAADRGKLFLSHYSTKQRGSGVGLAIVRRIVDEHGGRIEVTDNSPRGTRFALELPC
jgi:two-component system nitrogen regulation sensor histidine kinase NtrY